MLDPVLTVFGIFVCLSCFKVALLSQCAYFSVACVRPPSKSNFVSWMVVMMMFKYSELCIFVQKDTCITHLLVDWHFLSDFTGNLENRNLHQTI